MTRNRIDALLVAGLMVAGLLAGVAACSTRVRETPDTQLALMTTLPIYWGETAGIGETLAGDAPTPPVRAALESRYRLTPMDTLEELEEFEGDALLLAQPRVLGPSENVALDQWVRAGGRVLLLADPMLTGHSRFAIGDRRRPQDVILLSPILGRWGLELQYEDAVREGPSTVAWDGGAVPVNLPGRFVKTGEIEAGDSCAISAARLIASCRIGRGRVVALADAALLDAEAGAEGETALLALAEQAFAE